MSQDAPIPNYYAVLEIEETATAQQIRDAYKRAALKSHPDRVPVDSPERKARATLQFQRVNDAYFTLSDATRRKEYDAQRKLHKASAESESKDNGDDGDDGSYYFRADPETEDRQFADAFEEMLREEGLAGNNSDGAGAHRRVGKFWGMVGGASGAALGFIVANVPGMVAGAVAGNRLGAIRDAKGKSVYAVFQELPADDRARILSQLAARVFSQAMGV